MFNYKMAVNAAIEREELGKLLRGVDGYFYEDYLTSGPVDYASILANLYKIYEKHSHIDKQLENELLLMLDEGYNNFLMSLTYVVFHLSFVKDGDNSFELNINKIVREASKKIRFLLASISEEEKNYLIQLNKNLKSYGYILI